MYHPDQKIIIILLSRFLRQVWTKMCLIIIINFLQLNFHDHMICYDSNPSIDIASRVY